MKSLQFFLLLVALTDRFLDGHAVGIHSSLVHSICEQRQVYFDTSELQAPVKKATDESSGLPCGWFQVLKGAQLHCAKGPAISFMDCEIAKARQAPDFFTKAQTRLLKKKGDSEEERTSRIVGGSKAERGEFPSIVSLRIDESPSCGGTILNQDWILTAAHCKPYSDISKYKVVAGEYKLSEDDDPVMQTRNAVEYIIHEQYTDQPVFYDIGLIRVDPPFELNDKIKAVTLPDKEFRATGKATVCGWGLTSDGGTQSDTLLKVELPLISDEECAEKLGDNNVLPNVLCAGLAKGKKDACQGDSGGPLYQMEGGADQTLVGVVSWGVGCAEPDSPGVYTEVAYFIDWINKNTCQ